MTTLGAASVESKHLHTRKRRIFKRTTMCSGVLWIEHVRFDQIGPSHAGCMAAVALRRVWFGFFEEGKRACASATPSSFTLAEAGSPNRVE
jgi:hypothetical protein